MATDYTPIGPVPSGIANGTIDATSRQLARDMRGKAFGKDVRETIARMTEWHSIRTSAAEVLAAQSAASAQAGLNNLQKGIKDITAEYAALKPQAISAIAKADTAAARSLEALITANGIDAKATEALSKSTDADTLSKSVQSQFNQVVIDGDSSVEAAQARVDTDGEVNPTLKARLDKEHNEVTAQLSQAESKSFSNSMVNHKKSRGMITWIDDDANRGFYTKLRPLALEYGIVFTSAVITDRPMGFPEDTRPPSNSYVHYNEMKQMEEEGSAEFVVHTHTHDVNNKLTDMTTEEMHEELSTSKEIIKKHGWNHNALVYPFGAENPAVHDVVRQYFDVGIDVYNSAGEYGSGQLVESPFNQFSVQRVVAEHDNSKVLPMLDRAASEDKWIILCSHVDQGDWYSEEKVREIIEHSISLGLEWVTVEEGLKHHGNIAQYGNTTIDNEGTVYGGLTVEKLDSYEPDAPITDFPLGSVTVLPVRYVDSEVLNLPIGRVGGNLEVYRGHQGDDFSYERYVTNGYKRIFHRYWNTATGEWTPFINFNETNNALNIVGLGSFAPNAPLTEYPKENITIMPIRYSEGIDLNLPALEGGVSGMLETHSYPGSSSYSYQKFVATTLSRVFYRYWNGESWSDFKELGIQQSKIVSGTVTYTETAGLTQFLKYEGGNLPTAPKSVVIVPMGLDPNVTFSLVSHSEYNLGVRASKSDLTFSYIAVL